MVGSSEYCSGQTSPVQSTTATATVALLPVVEWTGGWSARTRWITIRLCTPPFADCVDLRVEVLRGWCGVCARALVRACGYCGGAQVVCLCLRVFVCGK